MRCPQLSTNIMCFCAAKFFGPGIPRPPCSTLCPKHFFVNPEPPPQRAQKRRPTWELTEWVPSGLQPWGCYILCTATTVVSIFPDLRKPFWCAMQWLWPVHVSPYSIPQHVAWLVPLSHILSPRRPQGISDTWQRIGWGNSYEIIPFLMPPGRGCCWYAVTFPDWLIIPAQVPAPRRRRTNCALHCAKLSNTVFIA